MSQLRELFSQRVHTEVHTEAVTQETKQKRKHT